MEEGMGMELGSRLMALEGSLLILFLEGIAFELGAGERDGFGGVYSSGGN